MTTNGQNAPLNEDRQTIAERERMDMDGLIASGGVPGCARLCQVYREDTEKRPVSQFRFAEKCCQEGFRFVARCRDVYEMHAYLLRSLVASAGCTSMHHRSQ